MSSARTPVAAVAPHPAAQPAPTVPLARGELLALACSVGLVPLNSTMIAVAIPAIAQDLAAAPGMLMQWLVTSYLLLTIVAQGPSGKLGDRLGHARVLTAGQYVFALGSVIGFLAHTLPLLVAARLLMAVAGAVIMPAAMAMLRLRLPEAQRARAFGAFGAVMGLSAAIGPLVGGEVAARLGWPALFLVNLLPLSLAAGLAWRHRGGRVRVPVERRPARFDILGSLLLGSGLTLVVVAAWTPAHWLPTVGAGLAVLLVFGWWERRAADPVIDLRLFGRPAFAAGCLIIGLQNFAMYALLFELPLVFTRSFGATSAQVGRALLALTLAMVCGSMAGGRVTGRLGARRAALLGTAVALAGGGLLVLLPIDSVAGALPAMVLLGLGLGLSTPAATSALMAAAPARDSGMASAMQGTVRYLGGIGGIALVSAMVTGKDLVAAHQHSASIHAAVLGLALVLAALIPDKGR